MKNKYYTLDEELLVLGFLEMILCINADDCFDGLDFFLRVPTEAGLLPAGEQGSWTRSRQFLCTFISQPSSTNNNSFSLCHTSQSLSNVQSWISSNAWDIFTYRGWKLPFLPTLLWLYTHSRRLDWIEQCFTSPPTQYRLYGRLFLQVKRPNQQYQSTEEELPATST